MSIRPSRRTSVALRGFLVGAVVALGGGALIATGGEWRGAGEESGRLSSMPTIAFASPVDGGGPGTSATYGALAGGTRGANPFGRNPISASSARLPASPTFLGPLEASAELEFGLALRMSNPAAIEAYLAGLYDPTSTNYRQFLTAAEFGAMFGLPLDRIGAVEDWATAQGFEVLGGFDQRTVIRLRATAGRVTDIFGVQLGSYRDEASGTAFHAPMSDGHVPAVISEAVLGVTGLDSRPARSSSLTRGAVPAAVPPEGLGPVDLAKAYDIVPLYEAGFLGDGQTVAIISFDTFTPSDIDTFDRQFGIDGPKVQRISVGRTVRAPGDGAIEVTLDIQIMRAIAPHVQILNFEAINGSGVSQGDLIDAIVQDGRADIVSDSWGVCDQPDFFGSAASRQRQLRALQAAAAAGVSIFVASGDHGAYDCWSFDPSDHRESVDFPSASPYTVSVGGTVLSVRDDGTYLSEVGWQEYLSTGGTGGGLNPTEPRPDWQQGPGVDNQFSNGNRQVPDVSASGGPDSQYQIFYTPPGEAGQWTSVYGTSAAAPFWAASMILIRQLADQQGVGRLGYVNPMLYALAAGEQGSTIFHDVTRGGNLLHPATPGWDYATGLGSPDVTALAGAIVRYLRDHPAPP